MSYLHLARSQSPECIKYKTWCIQRNRSADGLLKDLSDFLVEYQRIENQNYPWHRSPSSTAGLMKFNFDSLHMPARHLAVLCVSKGEVLGKYKT